MLDGEQVASRISVPRFSMSSERVLAAFAFLLSFLGSCSLVTPLVSRMYSFTSIRYPAVRRLRKLTITEGFIGASWLNFSIPRKYCRYGFSWISFMTPLSENLTVFTFFRNIHKLWASKMQSFLPERLFTSAFILTQNSTKIYCLSVFLVNEQTLFIFHIKIIGEFRLSL